MHDVRLHSSLVRTKHVTHGIKIPVKVEYTLSSCPTCGYERFVKKAVLKNKLPFQFCLSCATKAVREKNSKHLRSKLNKECISCGNVFEVYKQTWVRGTKKCHSCRVRDSQKLGNGEGALNSTFSAYRSKAKSKKLDFEISKETFKKIVAHGCHYCGSSPSNEMKSLHNTGSFIYNGIDRIDNEKGYVEGNVVPCCKICNYAKNTMSLSDFYSWVSRVYKHINKEQ